MPIDVIPVYSDLDGMGVGTLRNWKFDPLITSSSDSLIRKFTAGEDINGGRAVMIDTDAKIYLFDISNPYHYDKYLGISSTSVLSGEDCTVVINGKNNTLGPGWLPGRPYYIAAGGNLSTTPPSVGFLKQVAVGIDTDTIMIVSANQYIKI